MKKILYVIIGICTLYLILCFFGPSKIKVERSIDIKTASVEDLQHKLADLKFFHDTWSPWTRRDPGMKTIYAGVCCEPGSSYRWESELDSVGKGTMTFNKFNRPVDKIMEASMLLGALYLKLGSSVVFL